MKKILCLIFCLVSGAAFAKFCVSCGVQLPDKARFCLSCGQEQPELQPRVGLPPVGGWQPSPASSLKPAQPRPKKGSPELKDALIKLFSCVGEFERTIGTGVYSNIVGGYPEFKIRFGNSTSKFSSSQDGLSEELQILGRIFLEKGRICGEIVMAMKTMRLDSIFKDALIMYYGYVLQLHEKAIQKAKETKWFSDKDLQGIKARVQNIGNRTRKYQVTARFLKVGKDSLPQGSTVVVTEVQNGKAQVLALAETATESPVQGWVNLQSMQSRTTWTPASEVFFLKPAW